MHFKWRSSLFYCPHGFVSSILLNFQPIIMWYTHEPHIYAVWQYFSYFVNKTHIENKLASDIFMAMTRPANGIHPLDGYWASYRILNKVQNHVLPALQYFVLLFLAFLQPFFHASFDLLIVFSEFCCDYVVFYLLSNKIQLYLLSRCKKNKIPTWKTENVSLTNKMK